MGNLSRRPDRTPRSVREQRAYRLTVVGGTAAAVAVVGFVLAVVGILSWGLPLLAAAIAAIAAFLFTRTVSS
jgi:putative flippase GtrA